MLGSELVSTVDSIHVGSVLPNDFWGKEYCKRTYFSGSRLSSANSSTSLKFLEDNNFNL